MMEAASLVFALSPLLIVLFAFEMSLVDELYGRGILDHDGMGKAVAYVALKLPGSLVLPLVTNGYGAVLVGVLDIISVAYIAYACRKYGKA